MLVSNFTLGFNAPFTPSTDRWTSGYELQITNLDTVSIEFSVEARVTYHYFGGSTSGESVIAMLHQFLGRQFHADADGYYCYDTRTIAPNRAVRWNLGPSAYQERAWTPYVDGYITLRVPVIRDRQPPHGLVPQAAAPVPVLLSTRQQQQWRHDQSASELAISSADNPQLASGSAYNEIEPDTSRLWRPIGISTYVKDVVKASNVEPSGAPPWGGGVGALERIPEDELRRLLSRERRVGLGRGHDRRDTD